MNVTYGVQPYAWGKVGKQSLVGLYKDNSDEGFELDNETPYAELWVGSHKKCMSMVDGKEVGEMPYLLKVLSIDKALSIQAHPTKEHAEVLHKQDPANYPDDNHKPELLVALTETEALVCFRPVEEIEGFSVKKNLARLSPKSCGGLEKLMGDLLSGELVDMVGEREMALLEDGVGCVEDEWFLRLCKQFPGDTGALMVYVLNLVKMAPGEGVFLKPNEPHAYLLGNGVEIMAKSDNVVRAGLTPKFKDAPTLLKMLTYNTGAIDELMYRPDATSSVTTYSPPASVPEFQLKMVKLGGSVHATSQVVTFPATPGGSVMLVVKGSVTVNQEGGPEPVNYPAGAAALFPDAAEVEISLAVGGEENGVSEKVKLDADAVVFIASANCL